MDKKIDNVTIYKDTISFGLTRMWLYLKGLMFFTVIAAIFIIIDCLIGPKDSVAISWIGIGLAVFAFFFIAILPSEPMRAEHTAIMTEAILHNNIPQPCVEEGTKIALRTFPCMSFLLLFTEMFKSIMDSIRSKDAVQKNDFSPKLKSMIMFLLCSLVPYVGPCATSWAFSHQDKPTREGLLEGAHLFFANLKGMLPVLLINVFVLVAASVAALIGTVKLGLEFVQTNPHLIQLGKELLKYKEYAEMGVGPMETAMVYLVGIFFVYVVWVFARPFFTIPVLRKFYERVNKGAEQNEENNQ